MQKAKPGKSQNTHAKRKFPSSVLVEYSNLQVVKTDIYWFGPILKDIISHITGYKAAIYGSQNLYVILQHSNNNIALRIQLFLTKN